MRHTEIENPITAAIDQQTIPQMVHLIGQAEGQIFGSEAWGPGLFNDHFLNRLRYLRERIFWTLGSGRGKVIIGGAGTSGRLAIHAAALCGRRNVTGLMAGGMDAFFRAKEGVEDSPEAGRRDFVAALGDAETCVYVGISCGLSAAYVAGQAHEAMQTRACTTAIIGFNELEDANRRDLPGLDDTFYDILVKLKASPNGFVLNPIIGPEPIAGSTRMKGGSATRIILDLLLNDGPVIAHLQAYRALHNVLFQEADLADAVEAASQALRNDRGVAYLADCREGLMAVLDASECPPTFGAKPHHVTAYVPDDFAKLLPQFNMDGFRLSEITQSDLAGQALIPVSYRPRSNWPEGFQDTHPIALPERARAILAEHPVGWRAAGKDMALKWLLNAFSTCSFIRAGKVFGNKMIDLRISNLKLLDRAVRIVAELGGVSEAEAVPILNRVITGDPNPVLRRRQCVSLAAIKERVVPTAVLMAKRGIDVAHATELLEQTPMLQQCLSDQEC